MSKGVVQAVINALPPDVISEEDKSKFRYDMDFGVYLTDDILTTLTLPLEKGAISSGA